MSDIDIHGPEAQPCESYEPEVDGGPCLTCGFPPHEPNDSMVGAFNPVRNRPEPTDG